MNDVNLAFAFTAGIVATINPCGFAMLPAYLSYFLGIEANSDGTRGASIARALTTGSAVSVGFLIVFGVAGVLISAGLTAIREIIPWIAIAVGLTLVVLGTAVTAGKRIDLAIPKFERGTGRKDLRSLLLFGVSYAVASISCALPTFIVVVSTSVSGFSSGLLAFVTYAFGMAVTLLSLTVSLALARSSFLQRLRSLVRFVDRASGLLMVLAGIYLVMFWLTERTGSPTNWFINVIERWSANLSNTVTDLGGVRTGALLSVVLALGLIVWLIQFDTASSDSSPERL
jgi:cytochrome c-type biogenesis protein